MRAFVAVTDGDWYQFLSARPHLGEVNFWRPSGQGFGAISRGEPFLFKTHSPHNRIVGAGLLSGSVSLRLTEAWEVFGEANGVGSPEEMRRRIAHYRREPLTTGEDPMIGCVLLHSVSFVPPGRELPPPPDFARNIVTGKTYDLAKPEASYVEEALEELLVARDMPAGAGGEVFGDPRLTAQRVGQQAFKALILDGYQRRCAITGGRITPALEAAHIRPVSQQGENVMSNGLLLRSDVHAMFDAGYLGVDPGRRTLHVSRRLREEFHNGEEFYARAGQPLIVMPGERIDQPDRMMLEWHMDTVFKAS